MGCAAGFPSKRRVGILFCPSLRFRCTSRNRLRNSIWRNKDSRAQGKQVARRGENNAPKLILEEFTP